MIHQRKVVKYSWTPNIWWGALVGFVVRRGCRSVPSPRKKMVKRESRNSTLLGENRFPKKLSRQQKVQLRTGLYRKRKRTP